MMAWQLLVPLVVLLLSDGSSARKDVECAYFDELFCFYTKLAYKQARYVEKDLKGHPKFKDDEHRVSNLELEIREILRIEERYKLLPLLREALGMSTNALFQLKVSCTGKLEKPQCRNGLQGLFHVTYNLVVAALQITLGTQQHTIEVALKQFQDLIREGKNMTVIERADQAYRLGNKVESLLNITADATS